ncbi:hypothetical protein PIB30_112829, partial [Stylosanthes scabra]|nr:hypothetical protein [Stylosanthes scabra]
VGRDERRDARAGLRGMVGREGSLARVGATPNITRWIVVLGEGNMRVCVRVSVDGLDMMLVEE